VARFSRGSDRMSTPGLTGNAKLILDQWTESLADVIGSMTDQRPEIAWEAGSGPLVTEDTGTELLWWEQPFHAAPGLEVWVAAPLGLWEHLGTATLKAAGLETVAQAEARNTWFEILGQSLGAMARSLGVVFGREVTCDAGVERAADREVGGWASVTLRSPDLNLPPLTFAFGARLLSLLLSPPRAETEHREAPPETPAAPAVPEGVPLARSRTMELLLDVDLPVSISFGKTQLALKDVLKLTTGSIVELNRGVNDQVEVLVNECLIARGEVVVVEGNYGVRIQEIASRQDRLRSLR
jgi:flagellar motor switch protein FliN/FliY